MTSKQGRPDGSWLVEMVRYTGLARATFQENPNRVVEGPAEIHVTASGEVQVILHTSHEGGYRCRELSVETPGGSWKATGPIYNDIGHYSPSSRTFNVLHSEYTATAPRPATTWAMPLLNCVPWTSPLQFGRPRFHSPDIESHPLRMPPIPGVHPAHVPLILFSFKGEYGFIEPHPNYEARLRRLKDGTRHLVTAAMIGSTGGESIQESDLERWFPFDFLSLLSLAGGASVGAPWIEFRDAAGRLVRRLHRCLDIPDSISARGAIDEAYHYGGIGHLLTRAATAPAFGHSYLRVAIRRLIRANPSGSRSLEDKLSQLYRAFEGMAKGERTDRPYDVNETLASLSQADRDAVAAAIKLAATTIRQLKPAHPSNEQAIATRNLENIARKVEGARLLTTPFERAFLGLLEQYGLEDAKARDIHLGRDGAWILQVGKYRQVITHSGFIDVASGKHDAKPVFILARHLHDVLLRLILSVVGYRGRYQPSVSTHSDPQPIDWVKSGTPASRFDEIIEA